MSVIRHKKLSLLLSFETQSSYMYFLFICLFVGLVLLVFVLLLSYWNVLATGIRNVVAFLAIKTERF